MRSKAAFQPGDPVIYRRRKISRCPGPRARRITPSPHGDEYSYLVDKFWMVDRVLEDGRLLLRTRRGKQHIVPPADENLRSPRWWEAILYRHLFPSPTLNSEQESSSQAVSTH